MRGLTTTVVLGVLGVLALPALAADREDPATAPSTCSAATLPSGRLAAAGSDTISIENEFAEAALDGSVGVTPLTEVLEMGAPARALRAGDSVRCIITIRNRRAHTTTFGLSPRGIVGSRARAGASIRFVDPADPDPDATAASWLRLPARSVTLRPRQLARVPVTITIPVGAPTGTVAGSIGVSPPRASAPGAGAGSAVGFESRVEAEFLLRVGGAGRARLHLRHIDAPRLRWNRDPWTFRADLDNDGTLHATAAGRVRVRSPFGNTVTQLAIDGRPLLPGGRLRIERTWDGVPWFGLYRYDVRVAAAAGQPDAGVARARGWFVALPPFWVLVAAALALLAVTIAAVVRRSRERAWAAHDEAELEDGHIGIEL